MRVGIATHLTQGLGVPLLGRLAFHAFLAALLGYGGFYAYVTLSSFDVVNLDRDAFIDDAFYYFEIARNLATGKFSTFDGGITRTNGYHPVWLLLVTPFYWVFDLESALFGIRALELMLIAGGVCLMAVALRLAQLPWFLLFAALPALYVQTGMTMGMEAAAGAFFLGATLLAAVLFAQDARRWRWLLAAIAFLLPWVRLEYVAIALFVTAALGLVLRPALALRPSRPSRLPVAGLPFVAAIAGILAYVSYNGLVFGGVLPVSAAAKLAEGPIGAGADWGTLGGELLAAAEPHIPVVAELCCYVLAALGVARWRGWSQEAVGLLAVLATVLALAVENLAARAQIALFYQPGMVVYTFWYWVPGYLVAALLVPIRCCVAVFLLRLFVPMRWANWRRLAVVAVCAAGVAAAWDPYQFTEPFRRVAEQRHSSRVVETWPLAWEAAAFEPLLAADAILGSWDAGAIGYFAETPVVNLDGFVNAYDYLRTDPDKWDLWLRRGGVPAFGVTHLVQVPRSQMARGIASFEYVGRFEGLGTLRLWAHGNRPRPSKPWRAATSPGVGADGEPNGYRVIRHGRLMQVFVPDCVLRETATNVPEMLKFTWREGAQTVSERRLWLQPRRAGGLRYCTTSFLLPHGARGAAEIFVDGTTMDRVAADTSPVLRVGTKRHAYAVYAVQGWLFWSREPREAGGLADPAAPSAGCYRRGPSDGADFLHVRPAARRDLPYDRLEHGFVNAAGKLRSTRRRAGARCLAEVELPAVPIREIVVGEVVDGKPTWSARIDALALQPAGVEEFLAASARILRTEAWDVYHHEDERKLLFVREGHGNEPRLEAPAGCAAGRVFVHVHPRRVEDLPAWQRQHGFSNHDFDYGETGFVAGGRCLHAVALPPWDVSHVVAGAYGGSPHTWHAE